MKNALFGKTMEILESIEILNLSQQKEEILNLSQQKEEETI